MTMIMKICPMCEKQYSDHSAISRTRNHEEICPNCGTAQAMSQFELATSPTYQTRGIAQWAEDWGEDAVRFLVNCHKRHIHLDWGDMDEEDLTYNDKALSTGDRLFSSYNIPDQFDAPNDKIWIITEWDRSATTIMFPSEY